MYDREEVLAVAIVVGGIVEALDATVEPTVGALHGLLGILAVGCAWAAFVAAISAFLSFFFIAVREPVFATPLPTFTVPGFLVALRFATAA